MANKNFECKHCNVIYVDEDMVNVIDGFWICPICEGDNEVDDG
jgi:rubredoxin